MLAGFALPRMDDFNQIEVPPSFVALYTAPSGHRLLEPMRTVRERYELCEDLAQMLVDQAGTVLFRTGRSEAEVLAQMGVALGQSGAELQPAEAGWVVTRLAELLGWEPPAPAPGG
jgi:hypothetical protein